MTGDQLLAFGPWLLATLPATGLFGYWPTAIGPWLLATLPATGLFG